MRMQIYYLIGTEQVADNEAELIAIYQGPETCLSLESTKLIITVHQIFLVSNKFHGSIMEWAHSNLKSWDLYNLVEKLKCLARMFNEITLF